MILVVAEDDIAASRIGVRSDGARGSIRRTIGMNPNTAEIHAEARLEECLLLVRQRLPATYGINFRLTLAQRLTALGLRHRLQVGVRHPHHALGDVLGLLLMLIVRFADSKSG